MTLYQAAFAFGLTLSLIGLARRCDYRDQWAGAVIVIQTVLVWWQIDSLAAIAMIYIMAGATFLAFSVRPSGACLGVLSCLMALLAIFAALGFIPASHGQGIAFNFHHWASVLAWGQVGILGSMAHVGNHRPGRLG